MTMAFHDDVEGLTRRLKSARTSDEKEQLWQELFPKLRQIARRRIGVAGRSQQESATELVNDVFPGLQRALENPNTQFRTRGDFLAYAATAMRRHRASKVRRQAAEEVLDEQFAVDEASPATTIAISEAIDILAARLPRAVRAFELRQYSGYDYEEIMEIMAPQYRKKSLLAADLTLVRKSLAAILRGEQD